MSLHTSTGSPFIPRLEAVGLKLRAHEQLGLLVHLVGHAVQVQVGGRDQGLQTAQIFCAATATTTTTAAAAATETASAASMEFDVCGSGRSGGRGTEEHCGCWLLLLFLLFIF